MKVIELSRGRRWLTAVMWLLLIAALMGGFAHNFSEMWTRWFPAWHHHQLSLYDRIVEGESYYTHSPLIPPVSLLITVLLIRHTRLPLRPKRLAGAIVLAGSLLLHLTACLARVNFASGFAFIGVLAGLVLLLWGSVALRRLWFPIAMLVFIIPLPEVSIAELNFRLKMLAADWGVALAQVFGVIIVRSGNQVFLEGGKTLVIANVCNGLRTLISLLAFGAIYAYICRLRGLWRIWLFAMTILVAVISNSLRIVSLIIVADLWDTETAAGWFHDTSGILIFVIAFLMMFGLERLVLWARKAVGRPAKIIPLFAGVTRRPEDEGQWSRLVLAFNTRAGWMAMIAILLAAGGAWWVNVSVPNIWDKNMAASALPQALRIDEQQWHSYDMELDERTLSILQTRDYLFRRYVGASETTVDFCIIFSQDNRKGTHPPDLCLEGGGQEIIAKSDVLVDEIVRWGSLPCRELIVQSSFGREYYLYTYKCSGRYTRSFWKQQITIFLNGLMARNSSGALIRISTPIQASLANARKRARQFLRVAVPHLDQALQ